MAQAQRHSAPHVLKVIRPGLICLAIFVASCKVLLPFGSAPNPVPAPNVPTDKLLLDAESFPEGWVVFSCEPSCDRRERNGDSGRSFGRVDVPGHVIQHALYFDSERAAQATFQLHEETELPDTVDPDTVQLPSTAFTPPPEIEYRSPIADEQYLGCGVSVVPACRAGLRYGNYFIYFYFDLRNSYYTYYLGDHGIDEEMLHEGGLTFAQVEAILRAMDEHYAELFNISLPKE